MAYSEMFETAMFVVNSVENANKVRFCRRVVFVNLKYSSFNMIRQPMDAENVCRAVSSHGI